MIGVEQVSTHTRLGKSLISAKYGYISGNQVPSMRILFDSICSVITTYELIIESGW